ncbi:HEAT repeat domain-containing protein, partial [Marinilabilia sp.]
MNRFKNIIWLLLLAVLVINPATAQDNRTLETKIADLLVQMPVDDAEHRDRLMEEMLALDKEGMTIICDRVTPPGDGDDTRARFAVGSLSKYLSQPGHESDQVQWEVILLGALENVEDRDVKAFFIRNLEFAGTEKSLEKLAAYIDSPDLAAPAIKTMLLIDKKAAAEIFSEKLPDASEDVAVMLIKGLGNSGEKVYVSQIVEYAEDAGSEDQAVALKALSKLPHPDAEKFLMKAARSADYSGLVAIVLLDYAKVAVEEYPSAALSIAEKVQKKTGDIHVSIQAMLVKSALLKEPAGTAFLVNEMESSNAEYRGAVIQEAIRVKSPANQWVEYLKNSDYPGKQAEVLYLLGKLGDTGVKSSIPQYLKSKNSGVREEAAMTYALLAGGEAAVALLDYLESQTGVADQKAGLEALLVATSGEELTLMTQRFSSMPPEAQVTILKCLAAKGDAKTFETVYKAAQSEEGEVRREALKNLKEVSEEQNLKALLSLFDKVTDKEAISSVGE